MRTGKCADVAPERLAELYQLARQVCPDEFPHDETRELNALLAHISIAEVDALAQDLAEKLALPATLFQRDAFTIQGAGPVSLHDDRLNYPAVFFVIVVAHAGQLGLVDRHMRAVAHAPGEILLLDPRKKHAVVPLGVRGKDHHCARQPTCARAAHEQFLFLDFEIARVPARHLFARA